MARTRLLKPSFFTNDKLSECSPLARILFAALWCMVDRDGKVEDRPKKIKAEALPYDNADINNLLDELSHGGFVKRYEVNGVKILLVNNFLKHQRPHPSEPKSVLPDFTNEINVVTKSHDEATKPHEMKCGFVPSPFNLSPSNPSLEFDTLSGASAPEAEKIISHENGFERFWEEFPRKRRGNRDKTLAAYRRALKRTTQEEIHEGLEKYIRSDEVARGWAKGAEAWLNDDRWACDYSTPRAAANGSAAYGDSISRAAAAVSDHLRREEDIRAQETSG